MLAVTIPDLKPNSQDKSAFYLENIYLLFASSNGSVGSIPSTLVKPPPFSPPSYVIWVNSLWLMSLVISLFGATFATLARDFVSRSISISQSREHPPEIRARIRAILVESSNPYARLRSGAAILPMLHISLFLFLAGVLIYISNISLVTFQLPFLGIVYFTALYALVTVATLFDPTALFYTPFSSILFFMYALFRNELKLSYWVLPSTRPSILRHGILSEHRKKSIEKIASKPSPVIDSDILSRMLLLPDNDQALERVFDAIPGFCESKLVQKPLDSQVTTKLRRSLDGFLDRTFSSRSVPESDRKDRLIVCLDAAHSALGPSEVSQILDSISDGHRYEALKSVEIGHSLARWGRRNDDLINPNVRRTVAWIIARAEDHDDRWAKLVEEEFDIPYWDIRGYAAHGDSVLLAILNHVTRQAVRTGRPEQKVLESLSQFNIHNTAAELRHEFCALWNEVIQAAGNEEMSGPPTQILAGIRRPFTDLHQGTNATPIRFPAPTSDDDNVLSWPWSYRLCDVASHHPDLAVGKHASTSSTVPPPTRLRDSSNTPRRPTLSRRHSWTTSRDLATENAKPRNADTSDTSVIADPARSSNSGGSCTPQQAEGARTILHHPLVSALPTPISTPDPCHPDSVVLPPSIGSALMQTDHVRPSLGASPSTSTSTPLSVAPQAATVSNQYPHARDRTTGTRHDSRSTYVTIRHEDHRQSPPGGAAGP